MRLWIQFFKEIGLEVLFHLFIWDLKSLGINITNLDGAERLAYGWHYWFKVGCNVYINEQLKEHASDPILGKITMNRTALGTCHGLSKFPYIRDTRRSIGVGDFLMTVFPSYFSHVRRLILSLDKPRIWWEKFFLIVLL